MFHAEGTIIFGPSVDQLGAFGLGLSVEIGDSFILVLMKYYTFQSSMNELSVSDGVVVMELD